MDSKNIKIVKVAKKILKVKISKNRKIVEVKILKVKTY